MKIECKISTFDDDDILFWSPFEFVIYTGLSMSAFLRFGFFINLDALNDYLSKGYDNSVGSVGVLSWIPVVVTEDEYEQLVNTLEQQYAKKIVNYPELDSCSTYRKWWREQINFAGKS